MHGIQYKIRILILDIRPWFWALLLLDSFCVSRLFLQALWMVERQVPSYCILKINFSLIPFEIFRPFACTLANNNFNWNTQFPLLNHFSYQNLKRAFRWMLAKLFLSGVRLHRCRVIASISERLNIHVLFNEFQMISFVSECVTHRRRHSATPDRLYRASSHWKSLHMWTGFPSTNHRVSNTVSYAIS